MENRPLDERLNALLQRNRRNPNRNRIPQAIDTIGIEFEGLAVDREKLTYALASEQLYPIATMYNITRDASSEINVAEMLISSGSKKSRIAVNLGTSTARKLFGRNGRSVFGYEIVSKPLLLDDASIFVREVTRILTNLGEFYSDRCALHVHIGIQNSLSTCKTALAFATIFEDVLYMLAGMGKEYRGFSNNSAYARPVTMGLLVRGFDDHFYKVPNIQKAMSSKSIYEFYRAFGVNLDINLIKHHPARYFSVNLYSIVEKGTLEFRVANATLNARWITSYVKLCQAIAELVSSNSFLIFSGFDNCNLNLKRDKDFYASKLQNLLFLIRKYNFSYGISEEDERILLEIIDETPEPQVGKENVACHLRDYILRSDDIEAGDLQREDGKVIKSTQVDIHNITERENPL